MVESKKKKKTNQQKKEETEQKEEELDQDMAAAGATVVQERISSYTFEFPQGKFHYGLWSLDDWEKNLKRLAQLFNNDFKYIESSVLWEEV